MTMTDLTYIENSLFISFVPQTESGEQAWREMANVQGGSAVVLTKFKNQTLSQLRNAGYSVKKAKKSTVTLQDVINDDDLNLLAVLGV